MSGLLFSVESIEFCEIDTTLSLTPSQLSWNDDTISLSGDIAVKLRLTWLAPEILARGSVSTIATTSCARCLESADIPVQESFIFRLKKGPPLTTTAQLADGGEADIDETALDEPDVVFFQGDTMDLAPLIRDSIYLAVPMKPLCDPACRGLCPHCGQNLNQASCDCDRQPIDPRLEKLKEWSRNAKPNR